jgi:Flp pilus assembly protein TadG
MNSGGDRPQRRGTSGSAAIEFAMIAPILFVLIMGLIEVGVVYVGQFMLQDAINEAARLIRTGQVATGSMTKTAFRQYVCDKVSALLSCDGNLQIDVESFSNFSSASYSSPLNADKTLNTSLDNYSTGAVCNVVLVRGFYTWNVVTPLMSTFLVNMANSKHLISAAAAFRNEPYDTSVSGC